MNTPIALPKGHGWEVVKSWTTTAGLNACVVLVRKSHHCGYVEIPQHLKGVDLELENIDVHGGITHQGELAWTEGKSVVGYDCAHYCDATKCPQELIDAGMEHLHTSHGTWRDVEFCTEQCESLASQLIQLNTLPKP